MTKKNIKASSSNSEIILATSDLNVTILIINT